MTGNFDFYTTINNSDNADLTPYWEVAEAEHISNIIAWAEFEYYEAENALCCGLEWFLEKHSARLWKQLEEAKAILAKYGVEVEAL